MNWGDKIEKKDNCCNEKMRNIVEKMIQWVGAAMCLNWKKELWCDASSVSTDIVLEIGGVKTEEWLKKKKRWLQSY